MARVDKNCYFPLTSWKITNIIILPSREELTKKEVVSMRLAELVGYRCKLNKTQKEFATILGISNQAYSSKENGKTPFKPSEMLKLKNYIAKRYPNVTIDSIFF